MELTQLETSLLVVAVIAAGLTIWLLIERVRLTAERDLARQRLLDVQEGEERMRDSFRSLASETLQQSNTQFLQLAKSTLSAQTSSASEDFERKRAAVDNLVQPIQHVLQRAERQLRMIEKDRSEAYTGLKAQVEGMLSSSNELRRETNKLSRAMSAPSLRGRYGELQLQRVAELAGMQEYCDFSVQTEVRSDGRILRPDMVVKLPNGRVLAIDAKTSLDAYMQALGADNDADREIHLDHFAENVLRQVTELSKKSYWKEFPESPEFVVMFVPGDQFIDAALERRPDLIEVSARRNVILASPSTLIGLLRAVHVGWREQKLSKSAHELFDLGHELHDRVAKAMEYADKVGDSIQTSVRRYNQLIGSVEGRLLPTLRKFEQRGVQVGEEVRELKPVDGAVRRPTRATLAGPDGEVAVAAAEAESEAEPKLPEAGDSIEVIPAKQPQKKKVKRTRTQDEPAAKLVSESRPDTPARPNRSGRSNRSGRRDPGPAFPGFGDGLD